MDQLEDKLKVFIQSRHYQIIGDIAHFPNMRLTDFIVEAKQFIAVTDALVRDHKGETLYMAPFLNVHRDHIEIIVPAEFVNDSMLDTSSTP